MQTDNDMVTIAQNRDEAEYQEAETKYFSENWSWTFSKELEYIVYIIISGVINRKDPHSNFSTAFTSVLEPITKIKLIRSLVFRISSKSKALSGKYL